MNSATGEITGVAAIHQIEERDDAEFVKVFGAGVAAAYELGKTARCAFQVVLDQYQRTPRAGLCRAPSGAAFFLVRKRHRGPRRGDERIHRLGYGLRELLDQGFLYPKNAIELFG